MRKTLLQLSMAIALTVGGSTTLMAQQAASYSAEQIQEMMELAEKGVNVAQAALGMLYFKGDSVPQDYPKAQYWLELAALQNNNLAQFQLGSMYARGKGVPQNDAEALRWFGKSCAAGLTEGCQLYSQLKR